MDGIVALAADVVDFPLPLLGIVDGLVLKEHLVAYEDGRGANLKVRCRGRGHGGNLLGDGGCAGIIGYGQGDGVGAYLQESGRGVGGEDFLHVGAGHGPLIGGVDGAGAVDEAEVLAGGQVVLGYLEVCHGGGHLVDLEDGIAGGHGLAAVILNNNLDHVGTGLVESQVGGCLADGLVLRAIEHPLDAGGAGGYGSGELDRGVGVDSLGGDIDDYFHVVIALQQVVVDYGLDAVGIAYHCMVAAGIVADAEVALVVGKGVALIVEHQVVLLRWIGNFRVAVVLDFVLAEGAVP